MKFFFILVVISFVFCQKPTIPSSFSALIFQNRTDSVNYYWLHQDYQNQRFRRDILNTWQHLLFFCRPQNSSIIGFNLYFCYASCLNDKNCKDQKSCNCRVEDFNKLLQESIKIDTCEGQGHIGDLYFNKAHQTHLCVTINGYLVYWIEKQIKYDVLNFISRKPDASLFNYQPRCEKCSN